MTQEFDLRLLPEQAAGEQTIRKVLVRDKGVSPESYCGLRILKRSIDARQRTIYINLRVRVYLDEKPEEALFPSIEYPDVSTSPSAIVVGAGPGGLFAALRLIELGIKPIVVERGKSVHERKRDLALISREHKVDPESNYCFGEGGAGAFSDGKLYTRSKKRGNVEKILQVFCQFGASPSILVDAHPHIGTDKLPAVIENMREKIRSCGGEVHFETRMDDIILYQHEIVGIRTSDGKEWKGPVILATGHSARDVYRLLYKKGIRQEAKSMALGVRLEHPQLLIDQVMYHNAKGRGEYLPAAEYSFVTQVQGRGVYSFCMCPGGFVVPAASGPDQVVVNGMSSSNRGSKWANSGLVVEFRPEDMAENRLGLSAIPLFSELEKIGPEPKSTALEPENSAPELAIMHFQEQLEKLCYIQGGSSQTAPVQRMNDFMQSKPSQSLPISSYAPGIKSSALHEWLPKGISTRLQEGFKIFDRSSKGFLTNEALLLGVETRTSSPVRILRDPQLLEHIEIKGLYPCGEGAGYAGGIVSAAIDGERCAESLAEKIKAIGQSRNLQFIS
ncbi:MAG: FAD-binding protein [Bacteroidales bacterium]|nr:FAD-binding protein [Bacteroidales bacterium]